MKSYGYGYGPTFSRQRVSGGATPPAFTVAPVVSGTAVVNQTLTCDGGTVTGTEPITKTYQWQRDGVDIGGATASTYTLVQADAGNTSNIKCTVTATNSAGSASADSNTIVQILDADYNAVLLRGTALGYTLPNTNGIAKGNDLMINTLKSSGVFAKADVIHVYAQDGANNLFATLNWKTPTAHSATIVNSLTFTNKIGFSWASTAYLLINFNPSTEGVNYTRNNCAVLAWHVSGNLVLGGLTDGGELRIRQVTSQFRMNDSVASAPNLSGTGLIGGGRTSSTIKKTYKGGVVGADIAATSNIIQNSKLTIFNSNGALSGAATESFYYAGASIDAELSALNTGLSTYLTSL